MSMPGLPGLNRHRNIITEDANVTCTQADLIEPENNEIAASPEESDVGPGQSDGIATSHGQSDGIAASPGQSDGIAASPGQSDGIAASPGQPNGTAASPTETNSELPADRTSAPDGAGAGDIIEPGNNENMDSLSYLYSWRNIMQRLKDLPFDETNCSRVHSEITQWYHRVMQIQELPRGPTGVAGETPQQPDGIAASHGQSDGIAAIPTETNSELPAGASNIVPYSQNFHDKYRPFIFKHGFVKTQNQNLYIKVRRESLFLDSFNEIGRFSQSGNHPLCGIDCLRSTPHIEFVGSYGYDTEIAGEWFSLLSKSIFDPQQGLFKYAASGNTREINPESGRTIQDHLEYFKFVGRVVGISVFNLKNQLAECFFVRPFYKMMLGKPITLSDMETVDAQLFRALSWINNNDPTGRGLTFTMDENTSGTIVEKDLIPGGRYELVTEENKQLYIEKIIDWRFGSRIKAQMSYFKMGFNDVIPLDDIKVFDECELEFVLSGMAYRCLYLFEYNVDKYIDVNAWRRNTSYVGYSQNDQLVDWFWSIVKHHFTNETRARLIQLVTGTAKTPNNGVQEHYNSNGPQLFIIKRWGTTENLPKGHISSNRLDLPPYEKFSDLKKKLIEAVDRLAGCVKEATPILESDSLEHEENLSNIPSVKFVNGQAGDIPRNAFPGGENGEETLYIGRAMHEGSIIPGKVHPSHGCLYISYGGREHKKEHYDILVQEGNTENLIWVNKLTWANKLPSGAVQGGHEADGSPLYVARAKVGFGSQWTVGKFSSKTNTCYVPLGGREHQEQDYQVLCLDGHVDHVVL